MFTIDQLELYLARKYHASNFELVLPVKNDV